MSEGVRLTGVEPGGGADRAGLRIGDRLTAINGHPVGDQLDVIFHSSALRLKLEWTRAGSAMRRIVVPRPGEAFGWELEPFKPRRCANRCVFCFISQLPKGLREPLYFYDEDYRLSFLYGHYITGTNLTRRHLDRIVLQRLSPLYISVHATDPELRARMLGRKKLPPIADLFDFFSDNHILFHAQVVVCPGWNDGMALEQTLDDLYQWHPTLQSVAIVPVGLTAHREGLAWIRPVTPRYAERTIDALEPVLRQWRRDLGEPVLLLADEWYLKCGRPVPQYRGIDVAPQFENGVGMVAKFMRPWNAVERRLPEKLNRGRRRSVSIVTGVLAAPVLRPIVERLNGIGGLRVSLARVKNRLFGPSVTVSGLLAGRDVLAALRSRPPADLYLIPDNCLRPWDRIFLDDLTLDTLKKELDRPVVPVEGTCRDLVKAVLQ